VRVPRARNGIDVIEAPVVVLSGDLVLVNGNVCGTIHDLVRSEDVHDIPALYDALKQRRELFRATEPNREPPVDWVFAAPVDTPALVVKSIVRTAARAGYTRAGMLVATL
jgi:hypothetical protein